MKSPWSSHVMIAVLSATQLLGPVALWAAEQRGIRVDANRQIVVSALNGDQLTLQGEPGTKALQFREVLADGARVSTGAGTTAELLIGNRAVVTLGNGTTAQVRTVSADQTTIQVTIGMVRVAAAASAIGSQGLVTVQTPTSQVQTRGGIVRVQVDAPVNKAEHHLSGGQAYRASYPPETMVAAASPSSDLIHVEEGTAEILQNGGKPLMLQAGQRVTLQGGKADALSESVNQDSIQPGVVATIGHSQTSKEGREYLVALQVDQATKLGKALTGAAQTGEKESEKKSDTKNVINGATGGVTLQNNLVSALFGTGGAANPATSNPTNTTGAGYGGNNNNGFNIAAASGVSVKVNGGDSLLVFTRKDPAEAFVKEERTLPRAFNFGTFYEIETDTVTFTKNSVCDGDCLASHYHDAQKNPNNPLDGVSFDPSKPLPENVGFKSLANPILSKFTVAKELVLIGGAENTAHGGVAPTEKMIVRGASSSIAGFTNLARTETANGLYPTDRDPANIGLFAPTPRQIVTANSTFVVETPSKFDIQQEAFVGGTLGQYSNLSAPSPNGIAITELGSGEGHVDGAITATGANVLLKGGVSLDQETIATIGTTTATDIYFRRLNTDLGRTFSGSLLSVIDGPNGRTSLTMQNRMLGVYDGSMISGGDPTCKEQACNKALLSVLDATLKGQGSSIPLVDIAAGTHFDRNGKPTPGSSPNVTVTSALVTRSSIQLDKNPLDNKLLDASAPLFALTKATMTTTSHFADLAGNQAQSLNLNGALVALSASKLMIDSGHLLNLNNATAAIGGYLFSLNNGSTLQISNGSLFSLNGNSSVTLNGNAFGVFGSGSNTLTIENNLCTGPCGTLFNSARQPITLDGIPLKVSGVTQDVVLPNGFNAFALAPGATAANAKIDIDANDALFHLDPTSTLTINGTKVK